MLRKANHKYVDPKINKPQVRKKQGNSEIKVSQISDQRSTKFQIKTSDFEQIRTLHVPLSLKWVYHSQPIGIILLSKSRNKYIKNNLKYATSKLVNG